MKVILADAMGMCFGVRDALAKTHDVLSPETITIHGELVHNPQVVDDLRLRGFRVNDEHRRDETPDTSTVMITAHGVSNLQRDRLTQAGKQLLDTTCPLVTRVHHAALTLQREGYHILVIGRPGHVEVRGIVEDLQSYDVLEHTGQVRRYPHPLLGIVCQTTSSMQDVARIHQAIRDRNRHATIRFVDTVCQPTKDRQQALDALLDRVDAVVVVGGSNSNNTKQLVDLCRQRDVPAWQVQAATDLDPDWFAGLGTVGLTAGASTLDSTIQEVHRALLEMETATAGCPAVAGG